MTASTQRIEQLHREAEDAISQAPSSADLDRLRIAYLGRKAELPNLLREVSQLAPEDRAAVGQAANRARQALEALIEARAHELGAQELERQLVEDRVDVTLPGRPAHPVGRLHLLSATRRQIEDVFVGLGYSVAEGPEIELVELNFDALNHDRTHPARARSDTFYVADDVVLRTHTSPGQIRAMTAAPPPLFVILPGRVYRRDSDSTHTPQFHQIEGLAVDEDITLADLKGTLEAVARAIFGDEREVLLRPHFFPFTEPSVEVDVSCFACRGGWRKDGSRCPVCKATGWLEILGAGMVDPNVFAAVADPAYDPERIQGFAFGMGVERIAMLKHGVPDLRLLFDNDLRFLRQFP
ncbi:MAG TPA: phenylalanine--tRNA ligase subunit alpha [Solirubrobacteraceae bacterium]|nr:phenylalanine--tRNA ligase subunit alpha [Solirubrobacteraceae bacterium]